MVSPKFYCGCAEKSGGNFYGNFTTGKRAARLLAGINLGDYVQGDLVVFVTVSILSPSSSVTEPFSESV